MSEVLGIVWILVTAFIILYSAGKFGKWAAINTNWGLHTIALFAFLLFSFLGLFLLALNPF